MFLFKLCDVLSHHINERVLVKYDAQQPNEEWKPLQNLLDIDLLLNKEYKGLKATLRETIVDSFARYQGTNAHLLRVDRRDRDRAVSALLFGPPGTSKTQVAKAVARELHWPLLQIDPSHFLKDGFHNIYVQAEHIFEDMIDLDGTVVLFDELDGLVKSRDDDRAPLNIEAHFLTTYMLPKLAQLHERGRIVFFMATNVQDKFDAAIKRAGRFDLLLCMGPPTLDEKCTNMRVFLSPKEDAHAAKEAGERIREWCREDPWLTIQLELYTFAEFGSLVRSFNAGQDVAQRILALEKGDFVSQVQTDSATASLQASVLLPLHDSAHALRDMDEVSAEDIESHCNETTNVGKRTVSYLKDRRASRNQVGG